MIARRLILPVLAAGALASTLFAQDRITIPAVASIVGTAPFFSDVRVCNTSYVSAVDVTAHYRCFLGTCPASASPLTFTLAPRQTRAFDDMIAAHFQAPNSAGGVELVLAGGAQASTLAVTSRLYSTAPTPTVGMFIPGMTGEGAHQRSVLTQISNGGSGDGFHTNVGAFNATDTPALARFALYWEDHFVGEVARTIPAHAGVQINDIFGPNGVDHGLLETSSAVVTVHTDGPPVFAYAAVIDNHTTDPIFVRGAPDVAPVLSVGGEYGTHVNLVPGSNTCGNVTVQDNPTTIVQAAGAHSLTVTHAGQTYDGTVQDDGSFATQPKNVTAGGSTFRITVTGTFDPEGFQAQVHVEQTAPTSCSYLVDWQGFRLEGANFFP